jgi:hypothetical protein
MPSCIALASQVLAHMIITHDVSCLRLDSWQTFWRRTKQDSWQACIAGKLCSAITKLQGWYLGFKMIVAVKVRWGFHGHK